MAPLAIDLFCGYLVTCRVTGKRYIGITSGDVAQRWKHHVYYSQRERSRASALGAAIRKYGADAFSVEVICCARGLDDIKAVEAVLIQQWATFAPGGYNLTLGGQGRFGFKPSRESVEQSAAKHRGKPCHINTRAAASRFHLGKKKSVQHSAKIAAARRGVSRSNTTKDKIRAYWAARRASGAFKTSHPYEHYSK